MDEEGAGGRIRSSLLTSRGTAYVALKAFESALGDCQTALSLQTHSQSPQTLTRLAECCLAVGDPSAALKYIQAVYDLDIKAIDRSIFTMKALAEEMQWALDRSREAWEREDWMEAKDALNEAASTCKGDRPLQWLIWEVEIEMARKNWEEAVNLAGCVSSHG